MKHGKDGSKEEEKSESKSESAKEGDTNGKRMKVSIRIGAAHMMPEAVNPMPEHSPTVSIEKARKGFIISSHTYGVGGKDEKEFVKNLMGAPSILRKIFNTGNKSYRQIKDMTEEEVETPETDSA